jgi:F0F1-type ATP synthase membrane subunit b/b'
VKEEARNQALQNRSEVLGSVKAEVDRDLHRREAELSANVAEVKQALEREIPQVSRLLAGKILGREVAL